MDGRVSRVSVMFPCRPRNFHVSLHVAHFVFSSIRPLPLFFSSPPAPFVLFLFVVFSSKPALIPVAFSSLTSLFFFFFFFLRDSHHHLHRCSSLSLSLSLSSWVLEVKNMILGVLI
jgi:hypothetical protein